MTKLSPYFCTAPWTHTYVSPQGERRLCCASREQASFQKQYIDTGTDTRSEFSPLPLVEHWNSEYMKDIRKRILAGEKIDQCQVCNDQILNLHTYKQYFTETLFPHKIEEIIKSTDDTGYTTMSPVSYDYRISNLCNFKCRMCGEQLSSSWESEKILHNKIDFRKNKWMDPSVRNKISSFQTEVLEEELQKAVNNETIKEIYWVGGEPTLVEKHWNYLERLIERGLHRQVKLWYSINMTNLPDKLLDIWRQFKKVEVHCSIDDLSDRNSYIRHGTKWSDVETNLHKLKENSWIQSSITQTVSWMNIYYVPEFYQYFNNLGFHVQSNLVYDPSFYSIAILPQSLKVKLEIVLTDYKHLLEHTSSNENIQLFNQGIQYNNWLDSNRQESFKKIFPEWNNLIHEK